MTLLSPRRMDMKDVQVWVVPGPDDPFNLLYNDSTELNVVGDPECPRELVPRHVGVSYGAAEPIWGEMSKPWAVSLWSRGQPTEKGISRVTEALRSIMPDIEDVDWKPTLVDIAIMAKVCEEQGLGKAVVSPEQSALELLAGVADDR